jgi:ribosomal-protein-alanine N-acetyltransferase
VGSTVARGSDRLELRPLDASDADFVQALYADARVTRWLLRIQAPITRAQALQICGAATPPDDEHRFGAALAPRGPLVGLGIVRSSPERARIATIGYSMAPAFWSRGLGTELAHLLAAFAAATIGAGEIRATTLDEHHASRRILEKLGFAIHQAGVVEVDSRGEARRVTRWVLHP